MTSRPRGSRAYRSLLVALMAVAAACTTGDAVTDEGNGPARSDQPVTSPAPSPSASPTPSGTPSSDEVPTVSLLAVGDLTWCGPDEDDTAALAEQLPGTIALLGDLAYQSGTAEQFARCFEPTWGVDDLQTRSRPAVGNHDAVTDRGRPMFEHFGGRLAGDAALAAAASGETAAGTWPDGWYAYDIGAWHVVVINSNCEVAGGCGEGSRQLEWLRADLAEHGGSNVLAYSHHPRWSSLGHGPDRSMHAIWVALAEAGVDVVLAGHEHGYERRVVASGSGGPAIRQFIVGTGGAVLRPIITPEQNGVERRFADWYGLLQLDLEACGYRWRFLAIPDEPGGQPTVRDEGDQAGTCR